MDLTKKSNTFLHDQYDFKWAKEFVQYLKKEELKIVSMFVKKSYTILHWLSYVQLMNKKDFFELLKYFGITFSAKLYTQLFKYFDLNCDGSINKKVFEDRIKELKADNFDDVLNRFYELADNKKVGWVTKEKLHKFMRNNLNKKE